MVGHDGPRSLVSGALNTFSVSIPVQPGDVLGVGVPTGANLPACDFQVSGENYLSRAGQLADGESADFGSSSPDSRVNATAVVALKPANTFSFGSVKDNKKNGTATLAVNVPGPGTLSLTGSRVKTQRTPGGASASKTVTAAGTVKLLVKPKRKIKKKLKKKGKAKVRVRVTYTPNGTSTGDLVGDPNTQTKRVRLIKRH